MTKSKVVIQKIISPDGQVIAEAKSVTSTSSEDEGTVHQTVVVRVSQDGNSCSSSSSSSSTTVSQ